ncbi:MAG: DUF2726 domain-containing protein [Clostridia bacterium]|nr:DUF2726 domain-containing protein [Clostridia bacterium]
MDVFKISLIVIIFLILVLIKSSISHKKKIKKLNDHDRTQAQIDLDQGDNLQSEPAPVNGEKKYSPYSLDYIGRYKVRRSVFDSEMEKKIYPELRAFINDDYYVMPQVGWRIVFQGKSENMKISTRVSSLSFDFFVFNVEWQPVLCIEVHGQNHLEPEVIERDNFKKALLEKNNIPMAVIDAKKNIDDKDISEVVVQCIKSTVPDREHYPVYCPKCQKIMKIRKNVEKGKLFYGCSAFKHNGSGCSGNRNISDVPPLYENISIKSEEDLHDNTMEEKK